MERQDEQDIIRQAMSIIGRRKTEKKSQASRENGSKGGRPKGVPQSEETKAKIRATKLAQGSTILGRPKGIMMSEDTKEKMKQAQQARRERERAASKETTGNGTN